MSCQQRRTNDAPSPRHRHAEATELSLMPPAGAPSRLAAVPDIASADWDLLFQAVMERLEALARVPEQLATKGTDEALIECIAALDQLRSSATRQPQADPEEPRD